MSQIVTTPDGVEHEFPDGASDDVIKGALKSYSQPQSSANSKPPAPSTPWFSAGPGSDKIGEFVGKMANATTSGLGAKALDALGLAQGPGGQTVAQQVEAAGHDIGPYASAAADVAGYAIGPGKLGIGEGLGRLATSALGRYGENAVGRVGGRMVGSGIENAGATIVGNAALDQNTTAGDLLASLALGMGTGILPGGRGPRPETPSTADLLVAKDAKFAPLKTTPVNAPAVDAAFNGVTPRSGAQVSLSDTFKNKVADIEKQVTGTKSGLTAEDVADYQRELWSKARNGFDQKAAGQYGAALDGVVGPSTASNIKAANAAHNTYKTSSEIDNWLTDPSGAPSAIASRLAKKPDFYKSQPGLFDALSQIGQKAPSNESVASAAGKAAASAVGKHLLGAAIGGGVGYMTGQGIPGDIAGLALGAAVPSAAGRIASRVASIPTRNALLAARHLNATGVPVSPGVYTPRWLQIPGMLAQQGGYAAGASGAL